MAWVGSQLLQPLAKRKLPDALLSPSPEFVIALIVSALIVGVGIACFVGALSGEFAGGRKIKWAVIVSAMCTVAPAVLLLISLEDHSTNNPGAMFATGMAAIAALMLALAVVPAVIVLWVGLFLADSVRHRFADREVVPM